MKNVKSSDQDDDRLTNKSAVDPFYDGYVLRLYVTGTTIRSILAIKNIQRICETYLPGNYDLQVIDIYQYPEAAVEAQIIAAPTLIILSPAPSMRIIGDLTNIDRVLVALRINPNAAS